MAKEHQASIALGLAAVMLLMWGEFRAETPLFLLAPLFVLSLRFRLGPLPAITLVLVGIGLGVPSWGVGSDVLDVTRAAISQLPASPYGHPFEASRPPGAPFPYGPVALAWYALLPAWAELLSSIAIMGLLAGRGALVGLAIFATQRLFAIYATNGANDISMGLLILVGLMVAERWPRLGAAILGLAGAFKLYALAWLPGAFRFGGWRAGLAYIGAFAAGWLPAILLWGAGAIAWSLTEGAAMHERPWFSLAFQVPVHEQLAFEALAFGLGGLAAIWAYFWSTNFSRFIFAGAGIFLVVLFAGWWASISYLAALAPALCWQLDRVLFAEQPKAEGRPQWIPPRSPRASSTPAAGRPSS